MLVRIIHGFVGGALLLMWVWLLIESGGLPARLPTRFDGQGVPTAWAAATTANWLGPPAIGTFVALVLAGVGAVTRWLARRHPALVNIPWKDQWLALGPEARVWCLEPIEMAMAVSGLLMAGLFWYLSWVSLAVGAGRMPTAPMWPVWVAVGGMLAPMVASIVWIAARVRRAADAE